MPIFKSILCHHDWMSIWIRWHQTQFSQWNLNKMCSISKSSNVFQICFRLHNIVTKFFQFVLLLDNDKYTYWKRKSKAIYNRMGSLDNFHLNYHIYLILNCYDFCNESDVFNWSFLKYGNSNRPMLRCWMNFPNNVAWSVARFYCLLYG